MKNTIKTIAVTTANNSMFTVKERLNTYIISKSFYDTVRICIDDRTQNVMAALKYLNKRL